MHTVRHDLYQKQVRAKWIPRPVMNELERIWASEDYKAKCEIAKVNRASTTGGTQHKGGSIPNTEHKRRLALELGRDPSMFELFKKTHLNDKTGKFADQRAEIAHDEFMRRKAELSSERGSPSVQSNQEEFNIWLEVTGGKNKKGRIYGFGSEADDDICTPQRSSPSINSTSMNTNVETELRTRITELTQENQQIKQEHQEMKQNYSKIMSALEQMGIRLSEPSSSNINLENDS
ncbi:uncharacterized protein LOC114741041 [Neltuma alba]|uniref:uncharacterized protein LOC114741041 n=1 Tax=Neltuma alba TaxID=207710 RepID=UPI0010A51467|nr:uncharacterized protein LOC114741041 [Prosopis alba]